MRCAMSIIRPMSKTQHRLLRKYYLQGQELPLEVYDPEKDTPRNTNPLNALLVRGMITRVSAPMSDAVRKELRRRGLHKDEINYKDPAYFNTQESIWWAGGWLPFSSFGKPFLYSLTPEGLQWCQDKIDPETLQIIYKPSRNPYGCCRFKKRGQS